MDNDLKLRLFRDTSNPFIQRAAMMIRRGDDETDVLAMTVLALADVNNKVMQDLITFTMRYGPLNTPAHPPKGEVEG